MLSFLRRLFSLILNWIRRFIFPTTPAPLPAPPPVNSPPDVIIFAPSANVNANEAVIEYSVIDAESDVTSLEVLFQVSGGTIQVATPRLQDPRHIPPVDLPTQPGSGLPYKFVWDWPADIQQTTVSNVVILITPWDAFGRGARKSSAPINLTQPGGAIATAVKVISPSGGILSPPVLIEYSLEDMLSRLFTIEVKYSTDNGVSFATATPHINSNSFIDVPSGPQPIRHSFLWDAQRDLANPNASNVLVKLIASTALISVEDTSAPFDVLDNHPPLIDIWSPAGGVTTSPVEIKYILGDRESDFISITPQYQLPGGNFMAATMHPGSEPTSGLAADPYGVGHSFLWDAAADLSGQPVSGVIFQIKASDGFSERSDISMPFDVGSPLANVAIESPKGGTHGAPVPILFSVSDPSQSTVQGQVKFSVDQGVTFLDAHAAPGRGSEDLTSLAAAPSPIDHFFVWDAANDLPGFPANDIILQVIIINPSGVVRANSLPFNVTNRIPGSPPLPPITSSSSIPRIRELFFKTVPYRQSHVPLRFTVSDVDMKPTNLLVEFDAGSGFKPATPSALSDAMVGLAAPDIIFDHRFVWNAQADLGVMASPLTPPLDVDVRVTPYVGSKKGIPKTESIKVKVLPRPGLPPAENPTPMNNVVLTIEAGNTQIIAGGFLAPEVLKVKVVGPNEFGQLVPQPGVKITFKVTAPPTLSVTLEEDGELGTVTRADGFAGIRVRTPEVLLAQNILVKATVVGLPHISQTFSLTVSPATIASHAGNPPVLEASIASVFSFFIDADQDPNTINHLEPEKDAMIRYRIRATSAVIDNPFPQVPELDQTLFSGANGGIIAAHVSVLSVTPGTDVVLTVDIPSRPSITPITLRIPVQQTASARRRTSYNTTATTLFEDVFLKFELENGYLPGGNPQRAYPGLMLERPFKVKITDENGRAYTSRSLVQAGTTCNTPPQPEELEIEWSGTNLEFASTSGGVTSRLLVAKLHEEVYVVPTGYGPWRVHAVCAPGRDRFLDPYAHTFQGIDSNGNNWCYREHALAERLTSRVFVRANFLIERAELDLYDATSNLKVLEIKPGMRIDIRLTNFSPYTGTPDPKQVQLKLEQPNGASPFAQQGVKGKWEELYDLTRHSATEFRSRTIWITQGDSYVPASTNDLLHAVIPAASLVGRSNSFSFSRPVVARQRSRRVIGDTEMMQESPLGTSVLTGVNNTVYAHSGEYVQSFCDLKFASRSVTLSVNRSYRSHVISEHPQYEPLGPGWFLDADSFITMGKPLRWWRAGNCIDMSAHYTAGRAKGAFYDLRWNAAIDQNNSAFEMIEADGNQIHFNTDGTIRFFKNRAGDRTKFEYDEQGRVKRILDPMDELNRWIEFNYLSSSIPELNGRLSKVKDFTGREVNYQYYQTSDPKGGIGWLKKVIYPPCPTARGTGVDAQYQRSETYEYEPDPVSGWRLRKILDSDGNVRVVNHYDNGKIVKQEPKRDDADQRTIEFDYSNPLQTHVTDAKGNRTRYIFQASCFWDAVCAIEKIEDAGTRTVTTRMKYNHHGLLVEQQNPTGEKRVFIFDKDNFLQRSRKNVLAIVDLPQPVTSTTSVRAKVYTYRYETNFNNVIVAVGPDGNHPESDPEMFKVVFQYTTIGSLSRATDPDSLSVYRKQDGGTRWLEEGPEHEYEYNSYHQLKKSIDPMGIVTTYLYYPVNDPGGLSGGAPATDGGGFLAIVAVDTEINDKRKMRLGDPVPLEERRTQFYYNLLGDCVSMVENKGTPLEKTTAFDVNLLHEVNKTTEGAGSSQPIITHCFYNADFLLAQKELEQPGAGNVAGGDRLMERISYNRQGQKTSHEVRFWDAGSSQFKWLASTIEWHKDDLEHYTAPAFDADFPGVKARYLYDQRGFLKTVETGSGVTQLHVMDNGSLEELTMPSGNISTIKYDLHGEPNASIDAIGNIAEIEKDMMGRVVRTTFQQGHNANPNRMYPMPQLPNAYVQEQTFNENGVPRRTYQVLTHQPSTVFPLPSGGTALEPLSDSLGPDAATSPAITVFQLDGKAHSGDGRAVGDMLSTGTRLTTRIANDEAGYEMYGYNPHRELIHIQRFTGNDTSITYDLNGNPIEYEEKVAFRDANGALVRRSFFTKYDYNIHNRIIRIIDNKGNAKRMEYDESGFLKKLWDALGPDSTEQFHSQTVNDPGNLCLYERDALRRVVKIERSLTVNGMGNGSPLITPFNPQGKAIHQLEYHSNGGPFKAFIDHAGYHIEFEYYQDGLIRKVNRWVSSGGRTGQCHSTEHLYKQGTSMLEQSTDANGSVMKFHYHARHKGLVERIETIAPSNPVPAIRLEGSINYLFAYDGDGNLESIMDTIAGYELHMQWDNQRRLLNEKQGNYLVKNIYTGDRSHQLFYPTPGTIVEYQYDRNGRLTDVISQGQNIASFFYKGDGRIHKRTYGTISIAFEHDDAGRSKDMTVTLPSSSIQFQFERDRMGRLKGMTRTSGAQTEETKWTYDSLGRIVKEVYTRGGQALETLRHFDGDDVILKEERDKIQGGAVVREVVDQSRGYMGQITATNSVALTYDNNGNLTDDALRQYRYDPANRLAKIEISGQTLCAYKYDGKNRLIRRTAGNDVEDYVYNDWHLIEVRNGVTNVVKERMFYSHHTDDLIAISVNGATYRVIMNPAGNVDSLIDTNGIVIESYVYSLGGEVTVLDGNRQVKSTPPICRILFMGRVYDGISGLYQFRMRWYNPATGLFITPDPLGFSAGPNQYLLAKGDSVNRTDPYGLQDVETDGFEEEGGFFSRVWGSVRAIGNGIGSGLGIVDYDPTLQRQYNPLQRATRQGGWVEKTTYASVGVATAAATVATGGILVKVAAPAAGALIPAEIAVPGALILSTPTAAFTAKAVGVGFTVLAGADVAASVMRDDWQGVGENSVYALTGIPLLRSLFGIPRFRPRLKVPGVEHAVPTLASDGTAQQLAPGRLTGNEWRRLQALLKLRRPGIKIRYGAKENLYDPVTNELHLQTRHKRTPLRGVTMEEVQHALDQADNSAFNNRLLFAEEGLSFHLRNLRLHAGTFGRMAINPDLPLTVAERVALMKQAQSWFKILPWSVHW